MSADASAPKTEPVSTVDSGAWETVRMGFLWCFTGNVALTVGVLFLLLAFSATMAFGAMGSPSMRHSASSISLDMVPTALWALATTTLIVGVFGTVVGLALCGAAPAALPGRTLPLMALVLLIFGVWVQFNQVFSVSRYGPGMGGFGGDEYMGLMLVLLGGSISYLGSHACLLAFITAFANHFRGRALQNEVFIYLLYLAFVFASGCLMGYIYAFTIDVVPVVGQGPGLAIILAILYVCIVAVAILWFDKLLYQAWQLIRKDCLAREAALRAQRRLASSAAAMAKSAVPAPPPVENG